MGREVRNGLNFTERGFGVRAALGVSDRGHSAASQMSLGDVGWERIFGDWGTRWFHCGGVYSALSGSTAAIAREAMEVARRHGTIVSFDLNYRPSLWAQAGGSERAARVNRQLVGLVDVLLGNEEDFAAALGYRVDAAERDQVLLDVESYRSLFSEVLGDFPNLELVASTLRHARTATINDWSAVAATREDFHLGPRFEALEIYDRIGGGDSFASGLIHGAMSGADLPTSLAFGVAHGALAMTTPGDTSMATIAEVERLMSGAAPRVVR